MMVLERLVASEQTIHMYTPEKCDDILFYFISLCPYCLLVGHLIRRIVLMPLSLDFCGLSAM